MHYLDHAASSPLRPEAAEVYRSAAEMIGNPSSVHSAGREAKQRVEHSRETVAASLGASAIELVFTGSGTEAVNLALKGLFWRRQAEGHGNVVLVPEGEHHATLDTVEWLAAHAGARPVWIKLDGDGRIRLDLWQQALDAHAGQVAVASALWANNEIGTLQPVDELARLCAEAGVPLHLDAVAAYGHVPIEVTALRERTGSAAVGLVALSVSAHKIGGPQGIGALVVARQAQLESLLHGGGQQRRLRSGTEDVLSTVAFAAAAAAMLAGFEAENERARHLQRRLITGIEREFPEARINGSRTQRVSGNVHVSFPGCESDSLLFLLDQAGIAVSSGSACQAGVIEVSHVVRALGYDEDEARGSLRISIGPTTTSGDIDAVLNVLPDVVTRARAAGFASRPAGRKERFLP